jgi:catechol 2,3-dioxygenase-like lactoylglutathione lyase family enzyme
MAISRMDHFTIVTKDAKATARFYGDMLGFEPGPRPNFMFPGVWLYNEGKAILHVIEKPEIPSGSGVLDHMAFWGTDLPSYIAKLKTRDMPYDLRRLPEGGPGAGVWQLFFHDPNGARVEIDLPATEVATGHQA